MSEKKLIFSFVYPKICVGQMFLWHLSKETESGEGQNKDFEVPSWILEFNCIHCTWDPAKDVWSLCAFFPNGICQDALWITIWENIFQVLFTRINAWSIFFIGSMKWERTSIEIVYPKVCSHCNWILILGTSKWQHN